MFKDAIEAIGAVDSNHLFIVEGILLLTIDTVVAPLKAPNVVYGAHLYEGSLIPPFFTGDRHFSVRGFRSASRKRRRCGAALDRRARLRPDAEDGGRLCRRRPR